MPRTSEIRVRDPFILVDRANRRYLMVASVDNRVGQAEEPGFEVYASRDLVVWDDPIRVFRAPESYWGTRDFWAPELHAYGGRFYLFASFSGDGWNRGTQVLMADEPTGPYVPLGEGAQTPHDWMALDGTLWVEDGQPWMVFCHEWVQIGDGTVEAMPLSDDLSRPLAAPTTLFRATEAPWVRAISGFGQEKGYVTDGPFLYRCSAGDLLMIWSSYGSEGYALGIAHSPSGDLQGPWVQEPEPLFAQDGGHGMLFRDLEGRLRLVLHCPNRTPLERARFYTLVERDGYLHIAD